MYAFKFCCRQQEFIAYSSKLEATNCFSKIQYLLRRSIFFPPWYFSFRSRKEGLSSVERPKASTCTYRTRLFRVCVNSVGLTNLMLMIPHGRRPMMMRSGVNLARHSLVSVEWPWLLPLSLACRLYRNWRSLPPPIRSMEAACTKASGRTASTPAYNADRTKCAYTASISLFSEDRNVSVDGTVAKSKIIILKKQEKSIWI